MGLARRGKTLIWDLDVEAPGLHRLRALRSEGSVETGFFDWLIAWQTGGYKDPGPDELAAFVSAIRSTPFSDLALLLRTATTRIPEPCTLPSTGRGGWPTSRR